MIPKMNAKLSLGSYAIEVKNLVKFYGDFQAVRGISFKVAWGEIFGFLGPNGAGKTTTVKMLCGLAKIDGGNARVAGYELPRELKKAKGVIGVVPDTSNLYAELSCIDNLVFAARMYGINKKESKKRAYELLEFFGLKEKAKAKFKALSKGLKRKLTLAAALVHKPKILFLDEPTLGLDVKSKRSVWRLIRKLNSNGLTVFLTTHNISEAFELCHRIAIIDKGLIVARGSPAELRKQFAASEAVEVSFAPSPPIQAISGLPGISHAHRSGESIIIVASDIALAVESLARFARERGLKLNYIASKGVEAEEVFLKILGESVAERA